MYTIVQDFTPIGATVAEISVTGQKKQVALLSQRGRAMLRVCQ